MCLCCISHVGFYVDPVLDRRKWTAQRHQQESDSGNVRDTFCLAPVLPLSLYNSLLEAWCLLYVATPQPIVFCSVISDEIVAHIFYSPSLSTSISPCNFVMYPNFHHNIIILYY